MDQQPSETSISWNSTPPHKRLPPIDHSNLENMPLGPSMLLEPSPMPPIKKHRTGKPGSGQTKFAELVNKCKDDIRNAASSIETSGDVLLRLIVLEIAKNEQDIQETRLVAWNPTDSKKLNVILRDEWAHVDISPGNAC